MLAEQAKKVARAENKRGRRPCLPLFEIRSNLFENGHKLLLTKTKRGSIFSVSLNYMSFDPRTSTTDAQRRQGALELLGTLDSLGITQALKNVTIRLDNGVNISVGDRLLLGCWSGIDEGIERFATLRGKDISTPETRQALVERCTECYVRGLIAEVYGLGIKRFKEIEL